MEEILRKLQDKNDKAAYEFAKQIGAESIISDKYLDMIPAFANTSGIIVPMSEAEHLS